MTAIFVQTVSVHFSLCLFTTALLQLPTCLDALLTLFLFDLYYICQFALPFVLAHFVEKTHSSLASFITSEYPKVLCSQLKCSHL